MAEGYLLGYDIGSSFIKAALIEVETGQLVASASSPENEMEIISPESGWAEQNPEVWWENLKTATNILKQRYIEKLQNVVAIGISYQMHGLVCVDKNLNVLRPAIIWCDSRAVEIGEEVFHSLGEEVCLNRLLNSPGNFTASKLKWVMENEYDVYKRIYKIMLPGDYIAAKLTSEIFTTQSGLSEGILWDFIDQKQADIILKYYNISPSLIPDVVPTFHVQGYVTKEVAGELGVRPGIPVSYRAGDQPNNALSLKVLQPGEVAATAGTSGVVYGVVDKPISDKRSRINTFVHVNHNHIDPRYGVLLCINGTGILNSWLKRNIVSFGNETLSYNQMNRFAELIPAGSEGLIILPFGNGAERTLLNKNIGGAICNLDFNIHTKAHLLRAGQEGIAFAMKYGTEIMSNLGMEIKNIRAGNSNLFLSQLFCEAFATITNSMITLYDTDGAQGAARGAGIGAKIYSCFDDAFIGLKNVKVIEPNIKKRDNYLEAYLKWYSCLKKFIDEGEKND